MKTKRDQYNVPLDDDFGQITDDDAMNVASSGECTGLVPTPPLDTGEAEAYRKIYDVPVEQSEVNTPTPYHKKIKKQL